MKLKLVALALFYTVLILTAVFFMPDYGRSPDSYAYLESALSMYAGKGYLFNGKWNSLWPLGYSSCILLVYSLLPISVLWASKLVNIIFIYIILHFFYRRYKHRAFTISLVIGYLCRMASYTWSETAFISLLLIGTYLLYDQINKRDIKTAILSKFLYFILIYITFLIRYIGSFIGILLGILSLFFVWKKQYKLARYLFTNSALVTIGYYLYFQLNKYKGNLVWGGNRIDEIKPWREVLLLVIPGLINEFILLRDANLPDPLAIIGFVIQASLFLYIFRIYKDHIFRISADFSLPKLLFITGGLYLSIIFYLRFFSAFDMLTYRLLAPVTVLWLVAGIDWLSHPSRSNLWSRVQTPVTVFFLTVTVTNLLPKDLTKLHTLLQKLIPVI